MKKLFSREQKPDLCCSRSKTGIGEGRILVLKVLINIFGQGLE